MSFISPLYLFTPTLCLCSCSSGTYLSSVESPSSCAVCSRVWVPVGHWSRWMLFGLLLCIGPGDRLLHTATCEQHHKSAGRVVRAGEWRERWKMERKRERGGERGGEGDPFSDRDRKSGERERRRGLRETEVGVVTKRMSEWACVCVRVCVRTSSAAVRGGLQFLVLMGELWRDVIKALLH